MKELQEIKKELEIEDETTLYVVEELLKHCGQFYPDGTSKLFFEKNAQTMAMIPMAPVNPIDVAMAYKSKGHHCYVSMFLGPKIGHEISFRIKTDAAKPSEEFVNLLAFIANKHLRRERTFNTNKYELLDMKDWFGSNIRAVLLLEDTVFKSIDLKIGTIKYIHAFGIEEDRFQQLTENTGDEFKLNTELTETYINECLKDNPYLITTEK